MKKLIFVRHGRAEEQTDNIADFDRSLTEKGKIISAQIATLLSQKEQDPCVVVSSPAFRAYETALIFARELDVDPGEIILDNALYTSPNLKTLSELLERIDNKIDTVILFGHNPSFTEIPDRLSKEGCDFLPKSGLVCLSFKAIKWQEVIHGSGKVEYFLKPEKSA